MLAQDINQKKRQNSRTGRRKITSVKTKKSQLQLTNTTTPKTFTEINKIYRA